jgi:kinesin family protein C2/C3
LNLIDLAGSERISKSEAEGQRLIEACNINQSLTALGKVLYGLAAKQAHIPYRDSKLTHLLKDSLSGDAKTLMVVQVSPTLADFNETTSSLSFGSRVACVEKGKAKKGGAIAHKKKTRSDPSN